MSTEIKKNGLVRALNSKQAKRLLDRQAKLYLNISGKEFIRRWDRGEYKRKDTPEIARVAMMLPFGR
jgi:hypothetical protein